MTANDELINELRIGFQGLAVRIDETNSRLAKHDEQLSGLRKDFGDVKEEVGGLRKDFGGVKEEVGGLRKDFGGLHQAMIELKQEIVVLRKDFKDFKVQMGKKLDGIGRYLQAIDHHICSHDSRFVQLETRVNRLEERFDT